MAVSARDLKLEKLRRRIYGNFSTFVRLVGWPILEPGTDLIWTEFNQALCDHLQAVAERKPGMRRLGVAIPPGQTKSTIASILYPVWCWLRWPSRKYINCTHTLSLSYKFQTKRIQVIKSPLFTHLCRPSWRVGGDTTSNKGLLQNSEMGEIIATAIGAGITGNHCNELILDDPLTPATAATRLVNQHVEYIENTLHSRIVPRADPIIITVMQRLHQRDIFGVYDSEGMLDAKIVLPAVYEPSTDPGPTPLGWYDPRKPGDLLNPVMLPQELCDALKRRPRTWICQYQQRPDADEGGVISRSWFRWHDPADVPRDAKLVGAWDTSFSDEGDDPDMCAGVVVAIHGGRAWVVACYYGIWGFPELLRQMKALYAAYPNVSRWYVEKRANGSAALSVLMKTIPGLLPWTSSSPKEVRIAIMGGAAESGNVSVPDTGEEWVAELVDQSVGFPNVRYDDVPDALSMALLAERVAVGAEGELQQTIGSKPRKAQPARGTRQQAKKASPRSWR